jgi:hypothetical protein
LGEFCQNATKTFFNQIFFHKCIENLKKISQKIRLLGWVCELGSIAFVDFQIKA